MNQLLTNYIDNLNRRYITGISREHAYRADLQFLLEQLLVDILVTNEPARIECGAPDYILTKNDIPVAYIEAKDIGKPLDNKEYKKQFDRYKSSLSNLIITDYLEFRFFLDGELVSEIRLADIQNDNTIKPITESFKHFIDLITSFSTQVSQSITSPTKLSKMMANKAKLLATIIELSLNSDTENDDDSTLKEQMEAFKAVLIHDITNQQFADVYAQTLAYGMFAARLHDSTLSTFTRQEAAELIPKSNPFLRKLFQYIAGYDLDHRISWIIDALADIFRATDVRAILMNFGKVTRQQDPIIHFYETFLAEYDPKLRKSRGVWYTPEPVVNFIIRAVDDLLKGDFNLPQGLADTSKTTIKLDGQVRDSRTKSKYRQYEKEIHKVQILDPATGTGTFLAQTIKYIYDTNFTDIKGAWSNYVEQDLIPRINGFEILMASYAMAHLKLELLLDETGYKPNKQQRFNVFLTNSLEEAHPDTGTLFANWLSKEAAEANYIKRDTPVMVVMGNPPYSGISINKGEWITELIEDYKYIDGIHFGERKHWLNDDYVKFIRYGQYFVDRNGEGILAYINNHSFLDNPTFRGMRLSLLKSFDKIYIIDLHGNSVKKEICPDGRKDQNVFDIQAGVSINIFVKTKGSNTEEHAKVMHYDSWGDRDAKYQLLNNSRLEDINFKEIECNSPYYFFVPKETKDEELYNEGFRLSDLFITQTMGVTSARDSFAIDFDENSLSQRIRDFCDKDLSDEDFQKKYGLKENYQWKVAEQRAACPEFNSSLIKKIAYRPFDIRKIYYQEHIVFRMRKEVMGSLIFDNLALTAVKLGRDANAHNYFITDEITDKSITSSLDNANIFPLYTYTNVDDLSGLDASDNVRVPNLNKKTIEKIEASLGKFFVPEKSNQPDTFCPLDLLDYIYAVLHSLSYRKRFQELLKTDFPMLPYPTKESFSKFVSLGGELRKIHLMKNEAAPMPGLSFPIEGNNKITKKFTKTSPGFELNKNLLGRVWINDDQYFENIPEDIWEFQLGGYKPAQKWLKDRYGKCLNFKEIRQYVKIISALSETSRIMNEISKIKSF